MWRFYIEDKKTSFNNMKTKYDKIKTTTLMTIAVFALIGTTGISAQSAFANGATECTIPPTNMVGWCAGKSRASNSIISSRKPPGTHWSGPGRLLALVGNHPAADPVDPSLSVIQIAYLPMGAHPSASPFPFAESAPATSHAFRLECGFQSASFQHIRLSTEQPVRCAPKGSPSLYR